jgi:uncharacterized membrane protein YqhA
MFHKEIIIRLMNILKNKPIMKIYGTSVRIITFLNKYLYILSFISFIISTKTQLNENKYFKLIVSIIRYLLIINFILGTSILIYFVDVVTPFNITLSLYNDILKPYIEFLKNMWSNLNNLSIEDSYLSNIKESNNIKNQIKEGMKEGIKEGMKEALDEVLSDMQEAEETKIKSKLYKNIAIFSSVMFLSYFFFVLPGSSISPEELTQYNMFNQSLIDLKIIVKDLILNFFSKPSNPGTSGGLTPPSPTLSLNLSTITPNTPTVSPKSLINVGTQTILDGQTVGKMVETTNILSDVLDKESDVLIKEGVNKIIKNITD